MKKRAVCVLLAIVFATSPSITHEGDAPPIQEVIGDVGDVSFHVSCEGDGVQATFDRGIALLHHMTYEVAEREFTKVLELDPNCAMAHWGVANTLIHPVWPGLPTPKVVSRGAAEIAKARSLQKTEREATYIEALAAFFDDWETVDYWTRIRRWDEAQAAVREKYPDDDEAIAFAAVIHIAASPKDDLTYRFNREAGARLDALRLRRPKHPGAVHYTIHAYDSPLLAERALAAARSYDTIAPEVPHALHMPTHIFTRLGLWVESAEWNIRSREAARKLIIDGAIYREFAHASDYLVYAYLQAGKDAEAKKARDNLFAVPRITESLATGYAYAAVPARIEMERGHWAEVAKLEVRHPSHFPWDGYPACEAITHFARGIGAARTGRISQASLEGTWLRRASKILDRDGIAYWSTQVDVQFTAVRAWIEYAKGEKDSALSLMKKAADAEDALDKSPVTPGAVIPARELYAEMLAMEGRWSEALAAYKETLAISPNRLNALNGVELASKHINEKGLRN